VELAVTENHAVAIHNFPFGGSTMPQPLFRLVRSISIPLFFFGLLLFFASAFPAALQGQTAGEGTITGTVTDATGAVIGNAKVTATNTATNISATRTTSHDGLYTIAPLNPGTYTVTVEAQGFKTMKQENLDVVGLGTLAFNPVMAIGTATETVDVTSAPPVLDTDSATLGAVIENAVYSNLPLQASATQERDPTAFALLVQGAQPGADGRLPSFSGTPGHQASLYLDGVPSETLNQQGDNRTVALNVDVDSVDQFQVITSVPPAEYMGAGAENYTMKSGGLQFHGTVLDLIRNTAFDTYTFTQKQATVTNASAPLDCPAAQSPCPAPKSVEHTNELSAAGGGYIPHTGKKVFFFIAYDKFHGRSGTSVNFTTIPTALEEQGDFTELNQSPTALPGGGLTGIAGDPSNGGANKPFLFDPMTNSCNASGCTRQPFQGIKNGLPTYNVIPSADFSPISKMLESYLPNYPGSPNAGHINSVNTTLLSGNYGNQGTSGRDNYNWDWRWDWDISSKNRVSTVGAMGHDVYATNFSNFYNDAPYTTGDLPVIVPKQFDVEDAYTITPHLTNQLKYGYTRFYMPIFAPIVGGSYAPGAFGITNLPGGQGAQDFPNVSFSSSNFGPGTKIAPASWGAATSGQATQVTIPNTYALVDNVQWLKGDHVMTFGFSYMWEGLNNGNPVTLTNILPLHYGQGPTASYVTGATGCGTGVQGCSNNVDTNSSGVGNSGYGFASFLLGAADPTQNYNLAYAPTQYTRAKLAAPYAEDHWRATKKLVIDAGLRWDYIPPVHEKAIQLANGAFTFSYLNPTMINPATGYAGALEFAGNYGGQTGKISCGCTTPIQTYWKNWGPRLGVVYQIDDKTVLRLGAGITYDQGGGTGGGQLSGGVGGTNSSGQILGSSTTANSPNDVISGPNAGPSFWLGNQAYLGANANTDMFGHGYVYPGPPAPGTATQILNAGNYLNASGQVVTPGTMGYDDFYQSGRAPEYTFYNVGFERTITRDMTLTVAYVGSEAHHTFIKSAGSPRGYWSNQLNPIYLLAFGPLAGTNSAGKANSIPLLLAPATSANVAVANAAMPGVINTSTSATFIAAANAVPTTSSLTIGQLLLAFPQYSSVSDSWGGPNTENYSYNAFQLILAQRLAHGLTFNINYTYQKDLGDDGSFRSGFNIPAGAVDGSTQAYKADRIDRSLTQLDLPENLVAYGVYKIPIGTAGHWGGNSLLTREVVGGWQLSGVYTYGSGTPVNVTWSSGCTNQAVPNGVSCLPSINPNFTNARQNGSYGTGPNGVVLTNKTIQYLNPAAFQVPTDISTVPGFHQYLIGNAPRAAPFGLRNPGNQNLNAAVRRTFPITERVAFAFQADCFNVWNKQTWGGPNAGWSPGSTTFGQSGTPSAIRAFQFTGRLSF
jgi:hypothetical protein